jgi:hypothetical protein
MASGEWFGEQYSCSDEKLSGHIEPKRGRMVIGEWRMVNGDWRMANGE